MDIGDTLCSESVPGAAYVGVPCMAGAALAVLFDTAAGLALTTTNDRDAAQAL